MPRASHVDWPVSRARRSRVSKRGFADAARRRVDDALQSHRVVRIANQAQVAEHVFDFGALVEAESADHGVADVVAAQRFFNEARLRVGAVEDAQWPLAGSCVSDEPVLPEKRLNAVGDEEGFVFAVGGFVVADRASRPDGRSRASCLCGGGCWRRRRRRLRE